MGKFTVPKITWNTGFGSTFTFAYTLDNWSSYSKPRDGSEWAQSTSGIEDAWIVGKDYYLEGDIRWIPSTDTTSPVATGWDGSTGVRAFLEWAWDKNGFNFYPDKNAGNPILSYLVQPIDNAQITIESDGTRMFHIVMRNAAVAYDGY
jgi:hypothetical protein